MDCTPLAAARPLGALRAFLIIAAGAVVAGVAAFAPAAAAPGDAALACETVADVQRLARQADPDAAIVIYRGGEAKAFVAVVMALFGPAAQLANTTVVGTYVNSDPAVPVLVRFFDRDGCDFFGASTNLDTLREILAHMGSGA
jgi:hypothetical protein